jgi:hypothetical protein
MYLSSSTALQRRSATTAACPEALIQAGFVTAALVLVGAIAAYVDPGRRPRR